MSSAVFYVHSGVATACPPTKVTTVKRTKHVKKRKGPAPAQMLPSGYAFTPPSTPLTYPQSYHLIDAGPMNGNKRKVAGLPSGYAFVPPFVPLTYPESYHLIDVGPIHEAPKVKRTRTIFRGITNVSERISKRKVSAVVANEGARWELD